MSADSTDLVLARAAVVAAAKIWYRGRGNVEAPLAAAVQRLEELERSAARGAPAGGVPVRDEGLSASGAVARSLDLPRTGT